MLGVAPSRIDRVTLTISGGDLPSDLVQDLSRTDGAQYSGLVRDLPAGGPYTFAVDALDPTGARVCSGGATDVTIVAGTTAQVAVHLQEVDSAAGPVKKLPVIVGLSASGVTVVAGTAVHLSVTARDPEDHPLTCAWQDDCGGSFADAARPATDWTAPASRAVCQLSVRIDDAADSTSVTGYLVIAVQDAGAGDANVTAVVNASPVVTLAKASEYVVPAPPVPPGLSVGITADLVATASDPDGDSPTYDWTAVCSAGTGTFEPSSSSASVRFHDDDPTATCTIDLAVGDGRGGRTTVTLRLSGAPCAGVSCPAG